MSRNDCTSPFFYRALRRAAMAVVIVAVIGVSTVGGLGAKDAVADFTSSADWETENCGVLETLTVPAGYAFALINAVGGTGGDGGNQFNGTGGLGGDGMFLQSTYPVTPGQKIAVMAGCAGQTGSAALNDTPTAGWATGGGAGRGSTSAVEGGASGGSGGGATGVCIGSTTCTPGSSTLRMVAAGGGGGGVTNCSAVDATNSAGGDAGSTVDHAHNGGDGPDGLPGATSNGAGGSGGRNDVSRSGDGDTSSNGSGGLGVNVVGGGGGGGYRGGAAGQGANTGCVGGGGGGAGSSWVDGGVQYNRTRADRGSGSVVIHFMKDFRLTLTSAQNPSPTGTFVNFSAHLEATDGSVVQFATVDLYRNGVLVGTDQTNAGGTAGFSIGFSGAGTYGMEARVSTGVAAAPNNVATLDQVVSAVSPTTVAPTTVAPTTVAPTTVAPTTVAPTTVAPTTVAPTTVAPTTVVPTTVAPTTVAPTMITGPATTGPTSTIAAGGASSTSPDPSITPTNNGNRSPLGGPATTNESVVVLPPTGSNAIGLVGVGFAAISAGIVAYVASRRRSTL